MLFVHKRYWVRAVSLVPVLIVIGIIGLLYDAYVFGSCATALEKGDRHPFFVWLEIVLFHCMFFPFCVAYYKVVTVQAGRVPDSYRGERYTNAPPTVRTCRTCECVKPDRCHHCSVCGACVLKMDHHCPWVGNCVGYRNHKFFLQFVAYGALCCTWVVGAQFDAVADLFTGTRSGLNRITTTSGILAYILALSFSLALTCFTALHTYLIVKARTTLEMSVGSGRGNPYDLGARTNWQQVMGFQVWEWFVPIAARGVVGDGCHWPDFAEVERARRQATRGVVHDQSADEESGGLLHEGGESSGDDEAAIQLSAVAVTRV